MATRGGKRLNSGRKKSEPTVRMRIPESLVEAVKNMIEHHKEHGTTIKETRDNNQADDPFETFQNTLTSIQISSSELKMLPRHERRRIQKMEAKGKIEIVPDPF